MSSFANCRNAVLCVGAALLLVSAWPSTAAAQGPGVRAGVSSDPEQFYVGGHYESNPLVERLYFKPNAEFGFGDDITSIGLNFEFVYKVPVSPLWNLYGGAGPAMNIYSFNDDSEVDGGLNFLFGAETARGLFFELKLGAIDSPDLKFGVGYTWR